MISVYGGTLAAKNTPDFRREQHIKKITPDRANDLVTIEMDDAIMKVGPLTFKRDSIDKEFRVEPRYGSADVLVLHIPPTLKSEVKPVALPFIERGHIYLIRPSTEGGAFYGTRYRTEGDSEASFGEPNEWVGLPVTRGGKGGGPGDPFDTTFCLCASGKHSMGTKWRSGSCVVPTGSELDKLGHLQDVTAETEENACRTNTNPPKPLFATPSPYEVCFKQALYMNGSVCDVQWRIQGTLVV